MARGPVVKREDDQPQPRATPIKKPRRPRSRCDPEKIAHGPRGGAYFANNYGGKTYVKKTSKCYKEAEKVFDRVGHTIRYDMGRLKKKNIIGDINQRTLRSSVRN